MIWDAEQILSKDGMFPPRSMGLLWRVLLLALAFHVRLANAEAQGAEHVVVIGCDGMGSIAFEGADAPVMRGLMKSGAYTLHARGVMPTSSSPNWASMIMGAGPDRHGVTSNEWQPNKFDIAPIASGRGGIFPTVFGILREQRPRSSIVCIHDWVDFARLIEPETTDLTEHVKGSPLTASRAISVLREKKPTLTFIHFDDVDHAGHGSGWKTADYYKSVNAIDSLIGGVINAIKDAGIADRTIVLITADHGGKDKGHGGATMDEIEIPWIITGPGISPGREIKSPVNTYDTAPTIAFVLGLRAPECWIGKPVTEAFAGKSTPPQTPSQ